MWYLVNVLYILGCSQLMYLCPDSFATLLPRVFPDDWQECDCIQLPELQDSHINLEWLEHVWKYISNQFKQSLQRFEGLHLVPVSTNTLAKLSPQLPLIMPNWQGQMICDDIRNILELLNATVVTHVPQSLINYDGIQTYIKPPNIEGVLHVVHQVFIKYGEEHLVDSCGSLSAGQKKHLRNFLSSKLQLTTEQQGIISKLPLFETVDGSGFQSSFFVSSTSISVAAPDTTLCVAYPCPLIALIDDGSRRLAQNIGILQMDVPQVLVEVVFPAILSEKYSTEQTQMVMQEVLLKYLVSNREGKKISEYIQGIPFIRDASNKLRKPSELFDPSSSVSLLAN